MKLTKLEILYGMSEKSNSQIGHNNLEQRLAWYRLRADRLNAMKETKQVKLAKLSNQDRVEYLEHFIAEKIVKDVK